MDEDIRTILARHHEWEMQQAQEGLEKNKAIIEATIEICKNKGLAIGARDFYYSLKLGLCLRSPGIVRTLFPQLKWNDDNLVELKSIKESCDFRPWEGGFFQGNFNIFMHKALRRAMSSDELYSPHFVKEFIELDLPGVEISIAIDEDRVGVYTDGSVYKEFDTHYGEPFREDVATLKNKTVKLIPPPILGPGIGNLFYDNFLCHDIRWTERSGIKTFQAEEIKTEKELFDYKGTHYFPARYVHARYDLEKRTFNHFDGAIHLFDLEEYMARSGSDLAYNDKHEMKVKAKSFKVFRWMGLYRKRFGATSVLSFSMATH